jgi:hypothetical protein
VKVEDRGDGGWIAFDDPDPKVRAKEAAWLGNFLRKFPEQAQGFKQSILTLLGPNETWLTHMHAARMLPLLEWEENEYEVVLAFLFGHAERLDGFASAWALDALAKLSVRDASIRAKTINLLEEGTTVGRPALRARARKSWAELSRFQGLV